jgi:hypothetical protein
VQLEGLGKLKKSTSSGLNPCDLLAFSIVPQSTTISCAIINWVGSKKLVIVSLTMCTFPVVGDDVGYHLCTSTVF